jgi:hypothetical protein
MIKRMIVDFFYNIFENMCLTIEKMWICFRISRLLKNFEIVYFERTVKLFQVKKGRGMLMKRISVLYYGVGVFFWRSMGR